MNWNWRLLAIVSFVGALSVGPALADVNVVQPSLIGGGGAGGGITGGSCTNQFVESIDSGGVIVCASVGLTTDVTGTLPVANGGTGLTSGTSGGVPCYTAAGTISSSAALLANALVIGGGAGACPTGITAVAAGQVLVSGSPPAYSATPTVTSIYGSTSVCSIGALGTANSVCLNSNAITSEGSSADANKLTLGFGNHTSVDTLTFTAGTFGTQITGTGGIAFGGAARSANSQLGAVSAGTTILESYSSSTTGLAYLLSVNNSSNVVGALMNGSATAGTTAGLNNAGLGLLVSDAPTAFLIAGLTTAPVAVSVNGLLRSYIEDSAKALTDNTATTIFVVTLGNDTDSGGTVSFCVTSGDLTTTRQKTCGEFDWSAVDVTAGAGGETCTVTLHGTPNTASSSGTLAVTTDTTTGTDLCNVRVTADSSLDTASAIRYSVQMHPGAKEQVITPN